MLAGVELHEEGKRARGPPMAEFRPQEILAALDGNRVKFVLVGGIAAVLHGAPHVTTDVDVVPENGKQNLERLTRVLRELDARIRVTGEPEGVPFDYSPESLARVEMWNLTTKFGDLNIAFTPSGTRGYEDLRKDVVVMRIDGTDVAVASLADVIRSKEAAGRPRDRAALPALRELLSRQQSHN